VPVTSEVLYPLARGRERLEEIKDYLLEQAGIAVTHYVLRGLRKMMTALGRTPSIGHSRTDLTEDSVKFWSVFSYLIVYDPATKPVEIVRVLHASRDVGRILAH